jgi:two-component system, OmpR family, phosphate regulon sensor histidine kinase PhoR
VNRTSSRFLAIAWFIVVLTVVTCMFTASFFLTGYIYTIANLNPPALLAQIVNSLLGLFFTGVFIGGVSKLARSRGWLPEMSLFTPLIEAMQKIAKGDFSVRLDNSYPDNEPVGVLVKSMNDMALELNEMENMRQEFISNVSHEIQSPLTSIRGFAQALEDDKLSLQERHHYLDIIKNESTRLSRITEDLLRLAALESRRLAVEPKTYRLDKQVRSLILACEPQWTAKEIDMDVALEEAEIAADEDMLSQVWSNLIHNSIKFTPQQGKVCVSLYRRNGRILFSISDTGIGISEHDQAHIFERFYKADKSRTLPNGSSGLGLSIAKKIVEMHHGTIEVESRLGAGATFSVSLPVE